MNKTEKLMKDCLDNCDYYITSDGKYVFWGEMMTIEDWNAMEYDESEDIEFEIIDDDFKDCVVEEGITFEEAYEIYKSQRPMECKYEDATPLSPEE